MCHGGGIFLNPGGTRLGAIVHPHQVAARPLRQRADEGAIAVAGFAKCRGDDPAEGAEIVLRVVGEYGQRLSLCRANREH